jgi:hypothetical protein
MGKLLHKDLITEFRDKLDSYFADSNVRNMSSYNILVHQAEHNVKHAKSNQEKIGIVFQLIQGTGNLGIKEDKAILFHETIISGLNVLGAIGVLLRRYYQNIKDINPYEIEKKLIDLMYVSNKNPENPFEYESGTGFYTTKTDLFEKGYNKMLKDQILAGQNKYVTSASGNRGRAQYPNTGEHKDQKIDPDLYYSKEDEISNDDDLTDDKNDYSISLDGYPRFISDKSLNKKFHFTDKEFLILRTLTCIFYQKYKIHPYL